MEEDTITFLRSFCSKAKDLFALCDNFLAEQEKKSPKAKRKPDLPEVLKTAEQGNRMIPVNLWSKFHPWPSASGLRHILFMRRKNGADYFCKKIGKRILIDEKLFFEWVRMSEDERLKNSPATQAYKPQLERIGNRRLKEP